MKSAGTIPRGRIFWDGYGLDNRYSGVYVHAANLAAQLVAQDCFPTIVGSFSSRDLFPGLDLVDHEALGFFEGIAQLKPIYPLRTLHKLTQILKNTNNRHPVILHGLSNINLPVFNPNPKRMRMVITVHDLIPLLAKDATSATYRSQFAALLPRILKVADKIVCVSEWTRNTLIERYPSVESKAVVIRNGFFGKAVEEIKDLRSRQSEFVSAICVSRHETYKRLDFLLRVIRAARGVVRLTLVTNTGGAVWAKREGADLLGAGTLRIQENVSNETLQQLYSDHDVYVHPSLFEGFCLPAAEALAAGVPVVYQQGSGIDEVVGKNVGIPLPLQASPAAWVDACKSATTLRYSESFVKLLNQQLRSIGTWKDAASSLKNLYTLLLEE